MYLFLFKHPYPRKTDNSKNKKKKKKKNNGDDENNEENKRKNVELTSATRTK